MNFLSRQNDVYRPLNDPEFSEFDRLCDRFEQDLREGKRPQIEAYLAEAPESVCDELLAELLATEFEYLTQNGNAPHPDDYVHRFPQREGIIAGVFFDLGKQFGGRDGDVVSITDNPKIENFRPIKEIGRGGMGVVWLAKQVAPIERRVALKLIRSDLVSKEEVWARFDAEKKALSLMNHPNIARVLESGTTENGRPFFAMELVDGISLTRYCDEHKLDVDERLTLFVSLCEAVQHAHQNGVIHRDLKPANVLVTVVDGEAVPKIIDFGLVKAVGQNLRLTDVTIQTKFGEVIGTLQYMSPEQAALNSAECKDVDARTDVYSLGVILYELLTSTTPLDKVVLERRALLRALEIIQKEDPPRPSERLSSLSEEVNSNVSDQRRLSSARRQQLLQGGLDWIVMKALEKDRTSRYQTADELAQDISNHLSGAAVKARSPSVWCRVRKFVRRNSERVAVGLAIVFLLLAGFAGTGHGLIEANKNNELAEVKSLEADRERTNAAKAIERAAAESQRVRDVEAGARFQLAVARYNASRTIEARNLLHQIPREYRDNFEWNCAHQRFQGSDVTCYGHTSDVYKVAFSPDGKWFASASGDDTVKMWDSITGQELATFNGHDGGVLSLAVDPSGALIASAGHDKQIRVRSVESRQEVLTLNGHSGPIYCVAFDPSGDRLVSASDDGSVRLWDITTGEQITSITGHAGAVQDVAFSPDNERLASVGKDKLIRIWDARSGEQITELRKHGSELCRVAFNHDGKRLVATSHNRVSIWNTKTWQYIADRGMHNGFVRCVAFSPDGTMYATGADDSLIKLWDKRSGMMIRTLRGHASAVWDVAFSPDGRRLVSGGRDRTVKLWDVRGGNEIVLCDSSKAQGFVFDADSSRLAPASSDGTIKILDAPSNEEIAMLEDDRGEMRCVALSPDRKRIATTRLGQEVNLFDAHSGQEIMTVYSGNERVSGVAFSQDGSRLAAAMQAGAIRIWDAPKTHETMMLTGHTDTVTSVTFNSNGSRIYSEAKNEKLVWDVATREVIQDAMWEPPEMIVNRSRNRRWFMTSESNNVVLVDLEYKNTCHAKAYRKAKASFDPFWHQEQARAAVRAKDWYAATFQFAMLSKNDPNNAEFRNGLNSSYRKLVESYEKDNLKVRSFRAPVIKEMLGVSVPNAM